LNSETISKRKKFKAAVKRASKLLANDLFVKQKKEKEKDNSVLGRIYWSIIFLLISLPCRLRRDGFILPFFIFQNIERET
jgi:hypothetical protein